MITIMIIFAVVLVGFSFVFQSVSKSVNLPVAFMYSLPIAIHSTLGYFYFYM